MKKIWQKDDLNILSETVQKYTVWNDHILDMELLPYDIRASLAHGKMLYKIWVLTQDEFGLLEKGLDHLLNKLKKSEFIIDISQEDGHSAIEAFLTKSYWEIGKKIHTGRSRNDQILVAQRLFTLDKIDTISHKIEWCIKSIHTFQSKAWDTPMPGYTHTQKAMPTLVTTWIWMYCDALQDTKILIAWAKKINDQNPLWSAAWYGDAWFGIDRDYTSELLWFSKTQENPIYCWYSRWKFEYIVLQALSHVMLDMWKLANELVYFSSSEFNFFSLPDEYKTGSSIMPQKKNWDILELVRWNTNLFLWYEFQVREIYKMLFMWYNRDFQLTKEPYLKAVKLVEDTLDIMIETIGSLWLNTQKLHTSMTPELFATQEAYKLVKNGMSFRDAYVQVGKKYL